MTNTSRGEGMLHVQDIPVCRPTTPGLMCIGTRGTMHMCHLPDHTATILDVREAAQGTSAGRLV